MKFQHIMLTLALFAGVSALNAKSIRQMSGREIMGLNYGALSDDQQDELIQLAMFSPVVDKKSSARAVIDNYSRSEGLEPIEWDEGIRNARSDATRRKRRHLSSGRGAVAPARPAILPPHGAAALPAAVRVEPE